MSENREYRHTSAKLDVEFRLRRSQWCVYPGLPVCPREWRANVYIAAHRFPWAPSALTVAWLSLRLDLYCSPPGAVPGVGHEKAGSPGPAACTDQVAGWWMISPAWAHSQKSRMLRKCYCLMAKKWIDSQDSPGSPRNLRDRQGPRLKPDCLGF